MVQKISLIVAADENNAIGIDGKMPWHLPQDLRFFKNTTWAMPVIMGRKTFESVGKPLPGRTNIVVTRKPDWQAAGTLTASSIQHALQVANSLNTHEIFIIGGGTIYEATMPLCNRVYLTRVHTQIEKADTWFPKLEPEKWLLTWAQPFKADEKHAFDYQFECWDLNAGL